MAKDDTRPIVIKRIKKVAGGHHGGAWKIAYADFVTAMMAFFLLMWLLGSTAQGDLQGISEYFKTPLRVAMLGGSGSGDSSSVVKGGGKDLTRSTGQVKNGDVPKEDKSFNLTASRRELLRKEREHLLVLKDKIEKLIEENAKLNQFRDQIRLDITKDGLRIQIVDGQNRPMFDIGSAMLKDYTAEILSEIGSVLNTVDNRITLAGHTDATPFALGEKGYSNWELSSDRANASRRELIAAGMDEAKIVRVVGLASSVLFNTSDARDPANRRISIVVLNRQSAENIINDGQMTARDFDELEDRLARVPNARIGSAPGTIKE